MTRVCAVKIFQFPRHANTLKSSSPSPSVSETLRFIISPPLIHNPGTSSLSISLMAHSRPRILEQAEADCDGKITDNIAGERKYAEIVVIRHGETEWNADGRIQGHLDVELNDVGREQATAVAERVSKEFKVSAVYSSDLKRAFETAQIIASSCGGLQVLEDPDLRERHLGDLQGLVVREAAKSSSKAYRAFVSKRRDEEIPGGGESLDQLYQRCTSSLQRIANKHIGERVVAVTHGGVIRALHRRASSHGRSAGKIMNTCVNVFQLSDEDEWSIKVWGDVSHLNQTGILESGFGGDKSSG
nr:phosphoglycerate mutase-like protein 4 [Coffea arabica]XP_027078174.1 phosphoglycerate mutase-like protein 4 [Coffea arabica]